MCELLSTKVAEAIVSQRSHILGDFPNKITVDFETVSEPQFNIRDCKEGSSIFCDRNDPDRAATYINKNRIRLHFIKYEKFVNQFRLDDRRDWSKDQGRADYVVTSEDFEEHLIVHEISVGKIGSKESKGKKQIHGVLKLFSSIPEVKKRIDAYRNKNCYISARGCDDYKPTNPSGVASGFLAPYDYMPNPRPIKYQPIDKLGFNLFAGNIVRLD